MIEMTSKQVNVLDKGFVRLVDHMGSDLSIVRAARVSYDADWRTGEDAGKDEKLIRYLMTNSHTTPFETVVFTFEVKAPIFIFRQWHRHRTFTYNEISARYTELDEGFYVPSPEALGAQSKDNKQARDLGVVLPNGETIIEWMARQNELAFQVYRHLLEFGVPRELARGVIPLSAYSRMFATVDLHNLFHFLRLRLHSHAQYEIREYANALRYLIQPIVPIAVSAFEETLKL